MHQGAVLVGEGFALHWLQGCSDLALDLNVSCHAAKNWMKQETHVLSSEALQAWCRERGLFASHLTG